MNGTEFLILIGALVVSIVLTAASLVLKVMEIRDRRRAQR